MIRRFTSDAAPPYARGAAFGEEWREEIALTVAGYEALFADVAGAPVDLARWGEPTAAVLRDWAPDLAAEIEGIAAGAELPPASLYAINARTEVLADLGRPTRGECSTVVALGDGPPVSVQTWDWHCHLADNWLLWTIELPEGRRVETVTEFGILAKIAVNDAGFGVHFNLLKHRSDGGPPGVPVHVLARRAIAEAADIEEALRLVGAAPVSASTALTFVATDGVDATAVSVEVTPEGPRYVLPDESGLLVRTNHFLDPVASAGDREPGEGGDSVIRYDILRRRLAGRPPATAADAVRALDSHLGGIGALCAHPPAEAPGGFDYATLATVSVDLATGSLDVVPGGPCAAADAGYQLDHSKGVTRR
jgi:isopenicillin-N N-acyltransferase-like protein